MQRLMPVVFLSHGPGPSWLLKKGGFPGADASSPAAKWLGRMHADYIRAACPTGKPKAIVVVSAHWESDAEELQVTSADPGLLYDYGGFPEESYAPHLTYPAKGDDAVAERVLGLLKTAGLRSKINPRRGFDHGVFVPLKLVYPEADVPIVQVSMFNKLDAAKHIALGRALAPLREEGVLIVGSGHATHPSFSRMTDDSWTPKWDAWLNDLLSNPAHTAAQREASLVNWAKEGPSARQSHPREEHFLPLHFCFGAAGGAQAERIFHDKAGTFAPALSVSHFIWQ